MVANSLEFQIDKNEAKKLYESGMRQIDIAKHFNVGKGTIFGVIKKIRKENI